jgi:hypothetical protein
MNLDIVVSLMDREFLRLYAFLSRKETYSSLFSEGEGKLERAALEFLTSPTAPGRYPGSQRAGTWEGKPIIFQSHGTNLNLAGFEDITVDVMTALFKNGYRDDLMLMVDGWNDPLDEYISKAVKLIKEGRYRESIAYVRKISWYSDLTFFIAFGTMMENLEKERSEGK